MFYLFLRSIVAYTLLFLSIRLPPRSNRTDTLFPYTTLFRSVPFAPVEPEDGRVGRIAGESHAVPARDVPGNACGLARAQADGHPRFGDRLGGRRIHAGRGCRLRKGAGGDRLRLYRCFHGRPRPSSEDSAGEIGRANV